MHVTIEKNNNGNTYSYTFMNRDNPTTNKIDIYLKGYSERPAGTTAKTCTWDIVTPAPLNSKKFEDITVPVEVRREAADLFVAGLVSVS